MIEAVTGAISTRALAVATHLPGNFSREALAWWDAVCSEECWETERASGLTLARSVGVVRS